MFTKPSPSYYKIGSIILKCQISQKPDDNNNIIYMLYMRFQRITRFACNDWQYIADLLYNRYTANCQAQRTLH